MSAVAGPADLTLLVISDFHYVHHAGEPSPIPARRSEYGPELVKRAWERARRGAEIDAVVALGDLLDNGDAPGADLDLAAMREAFTSLPVPSVIVPGNHDGQELRQAAPPELHEIGGYRIVAFRDGYDANDNATRPPEALRRLIEIAHQNPQRPIIALQHNPVYEVIKSAYPYMPTNRDDILAAYREAGVALSLSGHYHPGQALSRDGDVCYVTCPAACEAPFRFLIVEMRGREVTVRDLALRLDPALSLEDLHAHTEFAYCAKDITAQTVISRALDMGLARVYLTEHSTHLYVPADSFWGGKYLFEPGICARERRAGRSRMPSYRATVEPLRSGHVGLGLEVDGDGQGGITLLDEDREGWDLIVGAVHYVPATTSKDPGQATVEREFMVATEDLLRNGVTTLAHPFRLFRRAGLVVPTHLFAPVADLLAHYGVAAEINYHTNEPAPRFFEMCLDRGVRIALGGDSHALWEVGAMAPHLELLRRIGVTDRELDDVLLRPGILQTAR